MGIFTEGYLLEAGAQIKALRADLKALAVAAQRFDMPIENLSLARIELQKALALPSVVRVLEDG